MKKLRYLLPVFLFLLVAGTALNAQTALNEGRVVYDLKLSGKDVDPMAAMLMSGANLDLAFKGNMARAAMDMVMVKSTAVVDSKAKKGIVLMNMMGKKMFMEMTPADIESNSTAGQGYTVRKTSATKTIAGYVCKQAIVKDTEGSEYEVWYTDKIKLDNHMTGFTYAEVDGFPLEMDIARDGMRMKMVAKSVSTAKQDVKLFNMEIPAGYEKVTQEELEKMGQ